MQIKLIKCPNYDWIVQQTLAKDRRLKACTPNRIAGRGIFATLEGAIMPQTTDLIGKNPNRPDRQRAWQKRSLETRERILTAAAQEFAHQGFDGASTRNIAAAAKVQHTLVTYHFQNKEGLWRATLYGLSVTRFQQFEERLAGLRGVDDSAKLYLYLDDFIQYSAKNPDFARIMAHVAAKPSEQLDWLLDNAIRPIFDRTAGLITAAQAAGKFITGEPKYLYYLFIGMATRIFLLSAEVEKILGVSPYDPEFVNHHKHTCLQMFFRNMPEYGITEPQVAGSKAKRRAPRTGERYEMV
ncbi:TetR/AcrR family transcriptional regulator [Novosphingobium sp.]|uniref:TetR/AcrR family transcriptional regulator n=1 Tax=Novosphingobium sp. TaxID=1874826 RepID=UPI0022CCCB6D|nr:TetR/AcrR family transcriptional regulator [Novosphingobium sp.]MCZ8018663.1 TetR/AcrR family transcriptional regulator [Novosphingobium sp.]MCZ8034668.1 TetR/AcrR family transcriptional regulator [Novosphingobium sp.]MCZ8052803.1 TetR/AcrR family transcriptional regulator [Novosphingobium sp.]MCZ8060561.1 TetR/AcrR family transcriptional regulator [Novosphingobium sp.]MCZ8230587.1 TetR/AcrR family transcriptional regulator [Novosphingobium sp.]